MDTLARMNPAQLLALAVFASYFLLIIGLFFHILTNLAWRGMSGWRPYMFGALAVASFAHTWYYMFRYMEWSFNDYESRATAHGPDASSLAERAANWLVGTALFEQAWAAVCQGRLNWWWSEQLCIFTAGAWTVFLAVEGRRHGIKHLWAYMLLGQLVAISVASNLFYLALALKAPAAGAPRKEKAPVATTAPSSLTVPVFLSLLTVALSPHTSPHTFLPNLLVMHALLVVPLFGRPATASPGRLSVRALYSIVTLLSILLRMRTTWSVLTPQSGVEGYTTATLLPALWRAMHAHPAQSSIGWDILWTAFSFLAFAWTDPGRDELWALDLRRVATMCAPVIAGPIAFVAPAVLRMREGP